ncbi:MAG: RNA methyltransferase [Clostridiales bacterium]|nr:RNA methyltransferase [Clostridiales bacterium]
MNLTKNDIKNLKDKKFRKEHSFFMLEGERFCKDLLDTNIEIVYSITSDEKIKGFPNLCLVSERLMNMLSTTQTGSDLICICRFIPPPVASIGNALILDHVQDPGNVGTLIRSAVAFGFEDVYLVDGADPFNEKVVRSSAGTILKARIHLNSFDEVKKNKSKIADVFLTADMGGENIKDFRKGNKKVAVIIGNEGSGVSKEFRELSDKTVRIPMSKKVESLNAGVAGSIIMQKLGE